MKHDAKRLRQVRESMGMTQEKLALLSSVSERTVQRAESGHTMSLETLNDFAAALEMPLSALVIDPDEINVEEAVGLRRVRQARPFLDDLAKAGVALFDCEVDAQPGELEALLKLVEMIEPRLPSPWEAIQRPAAGSLREKLILGSQVQETLGHLESLGICLYTAVSWINAQYPAYDIDEGHRYTTDSMPYERVMTLHLLIAKATEERIYRKPVSGWGIPTRTPPSTGFAALLDDDDDGPPF